MTTLEAVLYAAVAAFVAPLIAAGHGSPRLARVVGVGAIHGVLSAVATGAAIPRLLLAMLAAGAVGALMPMSPGGLLPTRRRAAAAALADALLFVGPAAVVAADPVPAAAGLTDALALGLILLGVVLWRRRVRHAVTVSAWGLYAAILAAPGGWLALYVPLWCARRAGYPDGERSAVGCRAV